MARSHGKLLFALVAVAVIAAAAAFYLATDEDQASETAPADRPSRLPPAPPDGGANSAEGEQASSPDPDIELDQLVEEDPQDIDAEILKPEDWLPIEAKTLPQRLEQIPTRNLEIVTAKQRQKLLNVLEESLLAYKNGDGAAILADRLRARYTVRPEASRSHRAMIRRFYGKPDEILPEDATALMGHLVNRHYFGENGSGYRNLYNDLSIQGSRIEFHHSDRMPQPMHRHLTLLVDTGARQFSNGMVNHLPSIDYRDSPEKVLQRDAQIQYADVWVAATDADNNRYSRFRRYYWTGADGSWLPMEMISLYARRRKADTFF